MRIRISSDSTCDLNRDYIDAHGVEIVPLYTNMGDKTYRDGVDITPADIYAHVAAGGALCSTAANNVSDYQDVFSRLLADCDAVIHINISAEFSSCYQNACKAALQFKNVYVVDSRNLSTGQGHVVIEAAQLAAQGLPPQEICQRLIDLTARVEASFLLDRLDYADPEDTDWEHKPVGEWVYEQFGMIPREGESFTWHRLRVTVAAMEHRRILKLLVTLLPEESPEGGEEA